MGRRDKTGEMTHSMALRVLWQGGAILLLALALGFGVNAARSGGLALNARWSPESQLKASSQKEDLTIALVDALDLFLRREAVFIDARDDLSYASGHIEGAVHLPWHDYEARLPEVLPQIPPSTRIITYCDGDACASSKDLAFALLAMGYTEVQVLINGWSRWQEAGLPIAR